MKSKSAAKVQNQANELASWNYKKLEKKILEMKSGFACARTNAVSNGIPHLRPFNIGLNGELDLSKIIHIPNNFKNNFNEYYLEPGDILFNNTNSIELVGKSTIIRNYYQCGFSNHLTRLRILSTDQLDPSWLLVCLRVLRLRGFFADNCNKWIGQAAFNPTKLAELNIPLPNIDIQRRIVARIETLLAEVKDSRSLINKMRKDADRLLAVALHEVFLKLESVTDIVPFSEVATAFNGKAVGEGDSSIRVFKSKHVYPHSLRLDRPSFMKVEQVQKMPKNRFLKPSDVLMANAAEGTLGRVTYVDKCAENWTVDGKIMILRSLDEQNLLVNKWLYYYLWSERGRREILFRRTGTAFAENRGQTGISPKSVLEIPVPKPPIYQQRQAVAYVEHIQHDVDEILKLLEQDANVLDMLEQSILERAFRG